MVISIVLKTDESFKTRLKIKWLILKKENTLYI